MGVGQWIHWRDLSVDGHCFGIVLSGPTQFWSQVWTGMFHTECCKNGTVLRAGLAGPEPVDIRNVNVRRLRMVLGMCKSVQRQSQEEETKETKSSTRKWYPCSHSHSWSCVTTCMRQAWMRSRMALEQSRNSPVRTIPSVTIVLVSQMTGHRLTNRLERFNTHSIVTINAIVNAKTEQPQLYTHRA